MKQTPIHFKLVLVFVIFAIVISCGLTIIFYNTAKNKLLIDIRTRLRDVATLAALQVNSEIHKTLHKRTQENSKSYRIIKNSLQKVRDSATDIKYIYTMRLRDNGEIYFVVDAEENPQEIAHLNETYDDASHYLQNNFKTMRKTVVEKDFYKDEWGTWLTGYAPVYDKLGNRECIVGIDISAKKVQN